MGRTKMMGAKITLTRSFPPPLPPPFWGSVGGRRLKGVVT